MNDVGPARGVAAAGGFKDLGGTVHTYVSFRRSGEKVDLVALCGLIAPAGQVEPDPCDPTCPCCAEHPARVLLDKARRETVSETISTGEPR